MILRRSRWKPLSLYLHAQSAARVPGQQYTLGARTPAKIRAATRFSMPGECSTYTHQQAFRSLYKAPNGLRFAPIDPDHHIAGHASVVLSRSRQSATESTCLSQTELRDCIYSVFLDTCVDLTTSQRNSRASDARRNAAATALRKATSRWNSRLL